MQWPGRWGSATIQDELKPWLHGTCKGWEECMKLVHVCKAGVGCPLVVCTCHKGTASVDSAARQRKVPPDPQVHVEAGLLGS